MLLKHLRSKKIAKTTHRGAALSLLKKGGKFIFLFALPVEKITRRVYSFVNWTLFADSVYVRTIVTQITYDTNP
jgi:hypothetical protein